MKHEVVMIRAPFAKRICAIIIDFFIMVCIAFLLSAIAVSPIIDSCKGVKKDRNEYTQTVLDTGLFQGESFETLELIKEDFEEKISDFYIRYDTLENYETLKGETYKEYFTYDETLNKYVPIDEENIKVVYTHIISNDCISILAENNQDFKDLSLRLNTYNLINIVVSLLFGITITFIVFPLVFSNGQTLSKKLLQLNVVSLDGDYHISKIKTLVRYLVLSIVEISLGIITFGIIPLISFLTMIFTKKKQALHDLVCNTVVVDSSMFVDQNNNSNKIYLNSYSSEEESIFEGEIVSRKEENVNE